MDKISQKIGVLLQAALIQLRLAKYHLLRSLRMTYLMSINEIGTIGEQLRYGFVAGHMVMVEDQWGASEVVKAASGRFVRKDANGRVEICPAGETEIYGHAEHREQTVSSTEGGTKCVVNVALDAVYKIPINNGTLARTMFGKTCDLRVDSSIQGVDLAASGEDVVQILDGDIANNQWVLVRINPLKVAADGVA